MNKKLKTLRRRYPQLTLAERVQLMLDAETRGDLDELYALDDTCPSADLPAYMTRLLTLEHAAVFLVVQLLAREAMLGAYYAARLQADPAAIDAVFIDLLDSSAALWAAFAAWCRRAGHDPHQVLAMAPLGPGDDDPARFILHQRLPYLESCAGAPDLDTARSAHWLDLFNRAFPLSTVALDPREERLDRPARTRPARSNNR